MRLLPTLLLLAACLPGQDLSFLPDLLAAPLESPEHAAAERALARRFPPGKALGKAAFAGLVAAMRNAGHFAATPPKKLRVQVPGGPALEILMAVPPGYDGKHPTPLVFALGGGPIPVGARGDRMVVGQARMMRGVWRDAAAKAGWLVGAVVDRISRSHPGVRYEILRPEHLELLLRAIRARFNVDEDRTFTTGISLGSNYSLACGAARPWLFCGAVPVSTEGEARTPLLRNLRNYPLYVLEGTRDRNIRAIGGPRALDAILTKLDYDHVYEEFGDRGHEGFKERYPKVLSWFAERPRRFWAREVLRVPHPGIMAPGRRFYWIACDTRQGTFRARVHGQVIELEAASLGRLELLLSDELLDLDLPIRVEVNGETRFEGKLQRDPRLAIARVRTTGDRREAAAARLVVTVPAALATGKKARRFAAAMQEPAKQKGQLAFWESYALRHLRETRAKLGVHGTAEELGQGRIGLRVRSLAEGSKAGAAGLAVGETILSFDGNRFFASDDPGALMELWCLREEYAGKAVTLRVKGEEGTRDLLVPLRDLAHPFR